MCFTFTTTKDMIKYPSSLVHSLLLVFYFLYNSFFPCLQPLTLICGYPLYWTMYFLLPNFFVKKTLLGYLLNIFWFLLSGSVSANSQAAARNLPDDVVLSHIWWWGSELCSCNHQKPSYSPSQEGRRDFGKHKTGRY